MRLLLMIAIALALFGNTRPPVLAGEALAEGELADNVQARLVAVRRSQGRAHNLIAKFETEGKDQRELVVHFPPNQTTPHERTLMALVESCTGGNSAGDLKWRSAELEAVFSIPKAGIVGNDRKEYAKCYLVSLKLKKGG